MEIPIELELRPAVVRKGLKTVHLDDDFGGALCGPEDRDVPNGTLRANLRRGLTLCAGCRDLALDELAAAGPEADE